MPILATQPIKAVYALLAVVYELTRFPIWVLLYTFRVGRPHKSWTFSQALRMRIVKSFLAHSSTVRTKTKLSLEPGVEGDRFTIINPQGNWAYKGPLADTSIRPTKIGAVWTPSALQRSQVDDADVVLHFHGGAYVIGAARDADLGFTTRTFVKHSRITHVLAPAYRLSSNAGGRFPAALQDAVSAYMHLTDKLRVPPSRITISGDSAGGNLALALLRYIHDHGKALGLPWPGCVWLWSPWVNVHAALDITSISSSPQYSTDYLGPTFGHWGASTFSEGCDPMDPYLTPLGNAFESKSPIFVQTGRAEVLYDDNVQIAEEFRAKGASVQLVVKEGAPHDIILVAPVIDFVRVAQEAAKEAGEFLRENRLTAKL
ncbi:alpha/beta-hydrolase [Microthyrium microscopicum]|uniref:Alpha/beta-hydrolase n=1 Tax=Microthyrium microscopicum TaxID=703497 RepID=A0A6A6UEA2_9PEZI|nr:alpha/beta-hydrolase [Microthyrium microscopicum]